MMITLNLAQRAGWRNVGAHGTNFVRNYRALLDSVDLYVTTTRNIFDENRSLSKVPSFSEVSCLRFCLMLLPYALVHLPVLDGQ